MTIEPTTSALRQELVDTVIRLEWPIDVRDCVLITTGWDHLVLSTRDGWIVRFSRDKQFDPRREAAILDTLAGHLTSGIPSFVYTAADPPVMAYRRLEGLMLSPSAVARLPSGRRQRLADSIAAFMASMHSAEARLTQCEIDVPLMDPMTVHRNLVSYRDAGKLPSLSAAASLEEMMAEYHAICRLSSGAEPVLLHNDLHFGNLALGPDGCNVCGVWDFSCVAWGPVWLDFRYLFRVPGDFASLVAQSYETRSGRKIDLEAARLALLLENLEDDIIQRYERRSTSES